jgi:hypothetical protein
VDHQHQLVVGGRQQKALRPALDAQGRALERLQRRVDRLQRGDVGRPRALDGRRGDERVELTAPRLDFG